MKSLFSLKSPKISRNELLPGDIFIEYDNVRHKNIRYGQRITGSIRYSNFVHGGIIDVDPNWLIHSNGFSDINDRGRLDKDYVDQVLDHKEYRKFRPNINKCPELGISMAEIANYMESNTCIRFSMGGGTKFNMLKNIVLFKNKKPPKGAYELRNEMSNLLDNDPDLSMYCTKFVAFVIQYACTVLGLDSIKILGNLRDTKATPARLVEHLKRSPYFTEFKSIEKNHKNIKGVVAPIISPPTQAWLTPLPAPSPPIARIAPQRPAPPPPINNLDPSLLQRQGAKRWVNPPILGPSPLQRQGARRWPKPPEQS